MVGGLRRHGGVCVLRAGAFGVRLDGGQTVGAGSPQDAVAGNVRVLWIVPGEGQGGVFDAGHREAGGSRWRVVLWFRQGRAADGAGLGSLAVIA